MSKLSQAKDCSAAASSSSSREKRLLREHAEVSRCPVANIVCEPLEDRLDEWHGNVRGVAGGQWEDVVVHFVVTFPSSYPATPPRVMLSTFIPHMNVVSPGVGRGWNVCLDMLERQPPNSSTLPYQYWSSAFSVRSLLLQLSSFLLSEDQPFETSQGNMTRAMDEAREFVCKKVGCCHTHRNPRPAFPSLLEVEASPMSFPILEVNDEEAQHLRAKIFERRQSQQQKLMQKAEAELKKDEEKGSDECKGKDQDDEACKSPPQSKMENSAVLSSKSSPLVAKPEWTTVKGRGKRTLLSSSVGSNNDTFPPGQRHKNSDSENVGVENIFSLLVGYSAMSSKYMCSECFKNCSVANFSKSQLGKGDGRRCNTCLSLDGVASLCINTTNTSSMLPCASISANKNFAKRERKRNRDKISTSESQKNVSSTSITSAKKSTLIAVDQIENVSFDVSRDVDEKVEPVVEASCEDDVSDEMCVDGSEELMGDWKQGWRVGAMSSITDSNMRLFSILPRDSALCVLDFLNVNDVLVLGTACRGTNDMIDDWVLWKRLLSRKYPRSALKPAGAGSSAWKHAYLLETNQLSSGLRCFHSFGTKEDGEILTMPLEYTINPKTNQLDYATSTFDVLSLSAFNDQQVRRSVWGEQFSTVLPYYLDEGHFEKSLKVIHKVARNLIGPSSVTAREMAEWKAHEAESSQKKNGFNFKSKGSRFVRPIKAWTPCNEPEMIMTLIVRLMNTQVVLLSDKGIEASEVALTGYCQLHRLLLAVVDKYPQLRSLINERLGSFIRSPETRVKEKTPSLGELMIYLSVSDIYNWSQLGIAYLKESFDRSVLWSCSKDSSLAKVEVGDESRLDKYLVTQKVSLRLTLFHSAFLKVLVRNGGTMDKLNDCKDRYDTFQGRPPLCVRSEFHDIIKSILSFDTWIQFFSIGGIPLPRKEFLLSLLEQAVGNSLRKGYHSYNTDFSKLMGSGVSKILLKGETYSAAPNLKRIQLKEKWRYDGNHVIFLDASCLVYSFHNEYLGVVDYASTDWGNGVIRHSGDIVYDGKGEHTIDIDILRIPSTVKALFFTVSAWTTTLSDISQPSCHLHDVESDTEMCRYKHEGTNTGDKTAVIMCKLHRFSPTSRWELTSIGSVGYGRAGNYTSIEQDIKNLR